jgi:hypothetical protein
LTILYILIFHVSDFKVWTELKIRMKYMYIVSIVLQLWYIVSQWGFQCANDQTLNEHHFVKKQTIFSFAHHLAHIRTNEANKMGIIFIWRWCLRGLVERIFVSCGPMQKYDCACFVYDYILDLYWQCCIIYPLPIVLTVLYYISPPH